MTDRRLRWFSSFYILFRASDLIYCCRRFRRASGSPSALSLEIKKVPKSLLRTVGLVARV